MKIVIIDDESLVRLGIKSAVDWERHGFVIAGEADNGKTGWQLIQGTRPDIVLLDILMPVMDGIAVLKAIRGAGMDCRVVVLSCHDDFHHVKDAMKYGAVDYLRKNEVNSANILTVMEEVRRAILREQSAPPAAQGGEQWEGGTRADCLRRLVGGEEPAAGAAEALGLPGQGLYCAAFAVSGYRRVLARYEGGNAYALESSIINVSREVIRSRSTACEIFAFAPNRYALLLCMADTVSASKGEEAARALLLELATVLGNYLNVEIRFGAGGALCGPAGLAAVFERARYSLELHYFRPDAQVLCEQRRPAKTLSEGEVRAILGRAHEGISTRQYAEAFAAFGAFTALLRDRAGENLDVDGIRAYFANMLRFILLQEQRLSEEAVQRLQDCETLEEAEGYIRRVAEELCGREEGDHRHYLIRAATEYIQQNLGRGDITLDEIAGHLMISKSYLCRLFQKNLGISVQQYIHNTRIERAKEYLRDHRYRIYEIAEMTGFNSTTHFNVVFKKLMRCTPNDYRNSVDTDQHG